MWCYTSADFPFVIGWVIRQWAHITSCIEHVKLVFLHGDFQSAVTSAFSAIEFFFGAVLNLLHWESGTPRPDVRGWFESEGFIARLRKRYHPLLGGNWNPGSLETITGKIQAVAELRGRVIHAGYSPTERETTETLDIALDAIDSLKAMLSLKRHKFTRTSLIVFGSTERDRTTKITDETRRSIEQEAIQVHKDIASYKAWLR